MVNLGNDNQRGDFLLVLLFFIVVGLLDHWFLLLSCPACRSPCESTKCWWTRPNSILRKCDLHSIQLHVHYVTSAHTLQWHQWQNHSALIKNMTKISEIAVLQSTTLKMTEITKSRHTQHLCNTFWLPAVTLDHILALGIAYVMLSLHWHRNPPTMSLIASDHFCSYFHPFSLVSTDIPMLSPPVVHHLLQIAPSCTLHFVYLFLLVCLCNNHIFSYLKFCVTLTTLDTQ